MYRTNISLFQKVAVIGIEIITMVLCSKYWRIKVLTRFHNTSEKSSFYKFLKSIINSNKRVQFQALILQIIFDSRATDLEGISYVSLNGTRNSLGHPSLESVLSQCFMKY